MKPSNILVRFGREREHPYGIAKISDFGLARLQEPAGDGARGSDTILTRGNTVLGTPDYVSPEQARSLHNTDVRSDLYSLGCTFYFLLTGRVPFMGGSSLEKLIRHSTEAPEAIHEVRSEVPSGISGIVHRLMAKAPDERYQSAAQLLDDLPRLTADGPFLQCPSALERTPGDDQLPTPLGEVAPNSDPEGLAPQSDHSTPEAHSVLNATVVMGGLETPSSVRFLDNPDPATRGRTWRALLWTAGIVVGVAARAGGVAWLAR